jgi:hypothetical protein
MVEVICDLAEGPSGLALRSDVVDDVGREGLRPSPLRPFRPRASRPSLLGDQPLELVDGDKSRSPRHFDCLDQR